MGTNAQFVGISTRTNKTPNVLSAALQALNVGLRVAIPGQIVSFNSDLQTVEVQPLITENVKDNATGVVTPTTIPNLLDVPLLIYSDQDFCLTLPNLVGLECLVIFSDMCFNSWWVSGPDNGPSNQERIRRHSLSDGFAILSPKSNPKAIADYSTDQLELRSYNAKSVLGMDTDGNVTIHGDTLITLNGDIKLDGDLDITATVGTASYTNINHSIPIKVNGSTYYLKLSTSP